MGHLRTSADICKERGLLATALQSAAAVPEKLITVP
jgi:hypothetical protein